MDSMIFMMAPLNVIESVLRILALVSVIILAVPVYKALRIYIHKNSR